MEKEAAKVIKSVLLGINYMHRLGIVHLDLKPDNVLVGGKGNYMLTDFGMAHFFDRVKGMN